VIVSVGSINADIQVRADRTPDGPGTILATDLLRTSGGKAANVAVLARRLGAEVRLLGAVGDDDLAEQALAGPLDEGVDVTAVRRTQGPTGTSSITVGATGDKTIVLALNANDAPPEDHGAIERAVGTAERGSVVVVDLEIAPATARLAVEAARQAGLTVVVDPAPDHRVDDWLLAAADHVTPDHREAAALTGIDAGTTTEACRAAEALRERGAGVAYVKLETGGCAMADADGTHVIDAPPDVAVVDSTGAGDAFAGALAWALAGHLPHHEAAALAVAASACAVGGYGSQESYPTLAELTAMRGRLADTAGPGRP
jgi:ribokinase